MACLDSLHVKIRKASDIVTGWQKSIFRKLTFKIGGATAKKFGDFMANLTKRVPENIPGDFFVDSTCIDCDACRQIAPAVFGQAADTSYVRQQPQTPEDSRSALHALLSCPTGSIGCLGDNDAKAVMPDFPLLVEDPVYYCGFNSPKSFGGNSYFIRNPHGNWLIDSPKFIKPLVRRLEELGGIDFIFLTQESQRVRCDWHVNVHELYHLKYFQHIANCVKLVIALSLPGHRVISVLRVWRDV